MNYLKYGIIIIRNNIKVIYLEFLDFKLQVQMKTDSFDVVLEISRKIYYINSVIYN